MKRIRLSISIIIFFLLLVSFGSLTYLNWKNHIEQKENLVQINNKRVMDKITTKLQLTSNYEKLFIDIEKEDAYIKKLSAFKFDRTPLTKGDKIPDEQKDIFTKTAKSIGAVKPITTEDGKFIFMHINPDGFKNTGDEVVVRAELDKEEETGLSKYFILILNGAIGLGTLLLLLFLSLITVGIGLGPLRRFSHKIPMGMHKGKFEYTNIRAEGEITNVVKTFDKNVKELDKINKLLSELSKTETPKNFIDTLFKYLDKQGLSNMVIVHKDNDLYKTLVYKGKWEGEKSIENFTISIEDLASRETNFFSKLFKEKTYVEIIPENEIEYDNIDVDIFGSPSIYMPLIFDNEVEYIFGGNGSLDKETKRILIVLTSYWGTILYGIINNIVKKQDITPSITETKEVISEEKINDIKIEKTQIKAVDYHSIYKEGLSLAKEKEYNKALEKLIPLTEIRKDTVLIKVVGSCYFNIKDYQNAIKYFEQLLELSPNDNAIRKFLEKAKTKL